MSIVSDEIKSYRSANVSNTAANGGIMSHTEVVSGVTSNLFPNASALERANGATLYRKMFMKVANANNDPLMSPRVWQDSNTVGQDSVVFFPASQRNVQSDITGVEPIYGMGLLSIGALLGATELTVEVEDGAVPIFVNGRLIRISNKATPVAAGDEFWVRIDQAPVVAGNLVTLHLAEALPLPFLSGAKVSSVFEAAEVKSTVTAPTLTSSAGGLAASWATYLFVRGAGVVEQNWTLTFTSATAFTITGDTLGAVGAGNISSGAAPLDPAFGAARFNLLPALFTGTFVAGDTLTFTTHPAAIPLFLRRTIPAGSVAISNNNVSLYVDGETS